MVEETITIVIVKVEESDVNLVVKVKVMEDPIVSTVGKMITSSQTVL
jgi:hypothetical protein